MIGAALALLMAVQGGWSDYDEADSKIGPAYQALMANLPPSERIGLRDEERAWIARRNAACGREARNRCATKFTLQRTAELESALGRTGWYRTLQAPGLLRLVRTMNDQCRGGPGQDPDGPVCARRDAVVRRLTDLGWCWGPDNAESEADRRWMRSGPRCGPYREPA